MLFIVGYHYAVHGGWSSPTTFSGSQLFVHFLSMGRFGVNCFVLATGYFLVNSTFKSRRALRVWGATAFYSLLFLFIFTISGTHVGILATIRSVLPILATNYWFVTAYIALYFISPFLNVLANAMSLAQYKRLIIVLFVMLSVVPTFVWLRFELGSLAWFAFLYLFAGYVRRADVGRPDHKNRYLITFATSIAVMFASIVALDYLGQFYVVAAKHSLDLTQLERLPAFVASAALFLYFKNLRIAPNKAINTVAATTFGIYLIHDNPLVRPYLWTRITANDAFWGSGFLAVHAVGTVLGVFAICMLIEGLRIRFVEEPAMRLVEKRFAGKFERIDAWMNCR